MEVSEEVVEEVKECSWTMSWNMDKSRRMVLVGAKAEWSKP